MSKILLVCFVSSTIGIGHLSRMLVLANKLKSTNAVIPEFLIFGDLVKKNELANFNIHNFPIEKKFVESIENIQEELNFDAMIFDIYPKHQIDNLDKLFLKLKQLNVITIAIDSLIQYRNIIDLIWIPSFNFDCTKYSDCTAILNSGWDSFLIKKRVQHKAWRGGNKVLILTGGSDSANLGVSLPTQLDKLLPKDTIINWVKGPFSNMPKLPKKCRLSWVVSDAPDYLDELLVESNYVLTVFGVSLFEALQYGIPTVVFSPWLKDNKDLNDLKKENVAMVKDNSDEAIEGLIYLIKNNETSKKYSINSLKKLSINGTEKLSNKIISLIKYQ